MQQSLSYDATQQAIPADRFAREIGAILARSDAARSRQLNGNPLGGSCVHPLFQLYLIVDVRHYSCLFKRIPLEQQQHSQSGVSFFCLWMLSHLLTWTVGGLLCIPVIAILNDSVLPEPRGKVDDIVGGFIIIVVCLTLTVGMGCTIQWFSLRTRLHLSWHWIAISLGSTVLGILLSLSVGFFLSFPIGVIVTATIGAILTTQEITTMTVSLVWAFSFATIGVILGWGQSLVLRDHVESTKLWIGASMFGLTFGWMAVLAVGNVAHWSVLSLTTPAWGLMGGVGGSTYSVFTGLALVWLFQRPRYPSPLVEADAHVVQ